MGKFFSFSRSQTIVMLTMSFVLILGVVYIFIYIPKNKKRVEEQRFRCLQNIQTNIKAKRDNSVALMKNLLVAYILKDSEAGKDSLYEYIATYPVDNFTLMQPEDGLKDTKSPIGKNSKNAMAELDAAYPENVVLSFVDDDININLFKGGYSIRMRYSVSQFFNALLPSDNFDQYLIMLDTSIVFQSFQSGIAHIQVDSLPTKHGAFSKEQVKNAVIGGNQYKLFAQEMNLDRVVLKVIGLLKNETYQDEKNELPGNVVIFLMIISIATILALPWIKLYQIGGQDRLTAADGMLTFPIAMLFISVLFFVLFKYDYKFRPGKNASENLRVNLANKLKEAFEAEIESDYNKLKMLDNHFEANKNLLTGEDRLNGYGRLDSLFKKWNIEETFWMNKNGQAIASWIGLQKNSPFGNFGNREYFRKIFEEKPLFLNNDLGKPMYIEPVVSWTTGKFVSVISKKANKSNENAVAAIAINLKCMTNPITSAGTSMCIINDKGRVLYHSNASRNLNEDILNELSEPNALQSALIAKTAALFSSKYRGKNYNIYTKPLDYLPYHILVFEDQEIMMNRDINVSYFCSSVLTGLFLIMILMLLVVFLLSFHTSYFKKHYFDISWIGPDERFHDQYILAFFWNILNIIALIGLYYFINFIEYLVILLVSVAGIILFLNYQYQLFYKSTGNYRYDLKRHVSGFLIALIGITNLISAFRLPEFPSYLLGFEIALVTILFALWPFSEKKKWIIQKVRIVFWNYSHGFSIMVFSALIVTSGIPIVILFTTSYNQELKLITRYRQKQFADELFKQYPQLNEEVNPDSIALYREIKQPNVFSDLVWVRKVSLVGDRSFKIDASLYTDIPATDSLYNYLSGAHPDSDSGLNEFYHAKNSIYRYFYNKDNGQTITYRKLQSGNYIRIASAGLRYNSSLNLLTNLKRGAVYWLIFGAVLFMFWAILHRILRKLFALDFPSQEHWEKVDEIIFADPELNSLLFLLGAPGSGKMKVLKKLIKDGKMLRSVEGEKEPVAITDNEYEVLDLFLIPDNETLQATDKDWLEAVQKVVSSKAPLIIVNHFEYDIKNPGTNRCKLDMIERLMLRKDFKIVIVSTVHPMHFLDSLNSKVIADAPAEGMSQNERDRWHVLLGHFRILIHKLEVGEFERDRAYPPGIRILAEETNRGHFLVKMQQPLETEFRRVTGLTNAEGSSLATKVGISAHYFYTYVWQSLTKEEKFLLYDLAEDGLVNPYDDYNITILISKGLIIRKYGLLKLFNEGFRTFILTAIGNSEVMLIRNQISDSGNWNKLRTPLIVIAVAVLVFLYASQNESYSEIIKYVGLITVIVPTVYKIFGAMESVFERKDTSAPKKAP